MFQIYFIFSFIISFTFLYTDFLFAEPIKFGQYHALLIANKDYRNWKSLTTPFKDVSDLKDILEKKYKFKVELLHNAKRDDIIHKLEGVKSKLTSRDNLLIYYAGHGTIKENDKGYWVGVDAAGAEQRSISGLIKLQTISELIDGMQARHVLLIMDSCYAGALLRGSDTDNERNQHHGETREDWLFRISDRISRTALTSGGLEPVTDSVGNSRNSIFAKELIRYLEANNEVTNMRSLATYISQQVQKRTLDAFNLKVQTPEYASISGLGDYGGDFILVPDGKSVDVPVQRPQHRQQPGITRGPGSTTPPVSSTANDLMWSTESLGRKKTWDKAKAYCKGYNGSGRSDWRIPTLEELTMANRNKNTLGITDQEVWAEKNNKPAYFNFEFGEGKSNVGSNYPHHVLCIAD